MTTDKSEALEALDSILKQIAEVDNGDKESIDLAKLEADYQTVKAALEEGYSYYATQKQVNELCEYANELKAEIKQLKARATYKTFLEQQEEITRLNALLDEDRLEQLLLDKMACEKCESYLIPSKCAYVCRRKLLDEVEPLVKAIKAIRGE